MFKGSIKNGKKTERLQVSVTTAEGDSFDVHKLDLYSGPLDNLVLEKASLEHSNTHFAERKR